MDMAREYLEKMKISCSVDESNWEYILSFIKNMDPLQNPEAVRLGLHAGLSMLNKSSTPKKVPDKMPPNQSSTMDKATWIRSRTDDPSQLGTEVWGAMYDLIKSGKKLPTNKEFILLQKRMVQEYLMKNKLSYNNPNDPNLEHVYLHFSNMDLNLPTWATQTYLDSVSGKFKKSHPPKSPLETLREASKRFRA